MAQRLEICNYCSVQFYMIPTIQGMDPQGRGVPHTRLRLSLPDRHLGGTGDWMVHVISNRLCPEMQVQEAQDR
jgi:hypothetical protein